MEYNYNVYCKTIKNISEFNLTYENKNSLKLEYTFKFIIDSPPSLINSTMFNKIKSNIYLFLDFEDRQTKSLLLHYFELEKCKAHNVMNNKDMNENIDITLIEEIAAFKKALKKIWKKKRVNILEMLRDSIRTMDYVYTDNYVFISYTSKDTVYAAITALMYTTLGLSIYMYELAEEINYPMNLSNEVKDGKNLLSMRISKAKHVDFIHTKSLADSNWVIWEYGVAYSSFKDTFVSKYYLTTGRSSTDKIFLDLKEYFN